MIKYDLTEEELQIEQDINKLRPVSKQKKREIEKIIDKANKNRTINLKVSNYDLERIKQMAEENGISYQTLINMILHKYINGYLFDREELIKMINVLRKKEAI